MRSSSKQNKNKKTLRYSWSDVIRHQFFITRPTLLAVVKAGNLKLVLWQKASEFTFLGLKTFLEVIEIPKP